MPQMWRRIGESRYNLFNGLIKEKYMAIIIVILIVIVLSLIPFFIDKGKEQIKVKKVKDTFYTMTGSKFFTDTLLGKHFVKAMDNKGYR